MLNVSSNLCTGAYNARWQGNKNVKPRIKVDDSIMEMRKIYSNLNDNEFIKWYCSKYTVSVESVVRVIEGMKGE